MATVNVHEAKTHFSKLLTRVESGEEITIAKSGKPVARIVPLQKKLKSRKPGSAKGQILLHPDFLAPLPEPVIEEFEQ